MTQQVAVIGAGIAGATCARHLAEAGWNVEIFEKELTPGGRMAAFRAEREGEKLCFDRGAQYFTVREEPFSRQVRAWVAEGAVEAWDARLITIDERGSTRPFSAFAWVGRPAMDAVIKVQLEGLQVRFGADVVGIVGEPGQWRLQLADGRERGFYRAVILATPSEIAVKLLRHLAPLQASAAVRARSAPCWALTADFDATMETPFDGAKILTGPLSWIARDASKPGRGPAETWVAHASPIWSRSNLDSDPKKVAAELAAALSARLRVDRPARARAHLWREALVERAVGSPFGWDRALSIGSCGDWYLGPRVEFAWTSGDALGRALAEETDLLQPAPQAAEISEPVTNDAKADENKTPEDEASEADTPANA